MTPFGCTGHRGRWSGTGRCATGIGDARRRSSHRTPPGRPVPSACARSADCGARAAARTACHADLVEREDLAGDYPVVRYVPPEAGPVLDLIARLGDRFTYEDLRFEVRDLGDASVRLATPATLYAMKHDTVRPVDRADAERLRDAFGVGTED